jgi:hypothetical protein
VKAIALWQPWASLIAVGAKRVETRYWPAPRGLVGQRIAIHAAKTNRELATCLERPFLYYLPEPSALPLGAIVATAELYSCSVMTPEHVARVEAGSPDEFAFGWWASGRFAWELRRVRRLDEPVPFVGRQGVFEVPDGLIPEAARA